MTYLLYLIKSSLFDFSRNKVRTFLTSLGILIGVAAVVLLLAFVLGLEVFIKSQFEGLGTNLVFIFPGRVMTRGGGFRPGGGTLGGVRFDEKDLLNIAKIDDVEYAVPFFIKTVRVEADGQSEIVDMRGTNPEAFVVGHLEPEVGILFDKADVEKRSKTVVIGPDIAKKLFTNAEAALGKKLRIEGQGFSISGILKKKGDISHDFDSSIIMPYKTAYFFNPDKTFFDIHVQLKEIENIEVVKEKINELLLRRYHEDDFSVVEQTEILGTIGSILSALRLALVGIAGVSLMVGGVGIMNIMYVSVTERTKEIGIRRAVGATKKDILYQFLSEAVILSLLGGLLGVIISFFIIAFVRRFFPAYINWQSVLLALGVSCVIGVIFGVFPAKKAADLSPIEAIRYE